MSKVVTGRSLVTVTIAVACAAVFARPAAAQNPFAIDGIIAPANNSGVCRDGSVPTENNPVGCPATANPTPQAKQEGDPNGSGKELGPKNASTTKIGVIHTAPVPMLGETNPNAQVDLNRVLLQDAKADNGDFWVYFAWLRDSNSGSGFVSLEAQQRPSGCNYSSNTGLLQCNPWANRSVGDFLISWDQQGGSRDIYLRTFNGSGFTTPSTCPSADVTPLGCKLNAANAVALYTVQNAAHQAGEGGELAINLTGLQLVDPSACTAFANVIPGTVTGNSDTADYKDVVLRPMSITTCGSVTVTKVTLDPQSVRIADPSAVFSYTLTNTDTINATINGCKSENNAVVCNTNTHADVHASTYTLTETNVPSQYQLVSITCDGVDLNKGALSFAVTTEEVACVITNQLIPGNPSIVTTPTVRALFYDSALITLERAIPTGTQKTVTFELFRNSANCETGSQGTRAATVTFSSGGNGTTTATIGTVTTLAAGTGVPPAFLVVDDATYYWKVSYPGDQLNASATTCGEATSVSVSTAP